MTNKQYIITTDGMDQGWLDAFNSYAKTNIKMNAIIDQTTADKADEFNNVFACGPAIITTPITDSNPKEDSK